MYFNVLKRWKTTEWVYLVERIMKEAENMADKNINNRRVKWKRKEKKKKW